MFDIKLLIEEINPKDFTLNRCFFFSFFFFLLLFGPPHFNFSHSFFIYSSFTLLLFGSGFKKRLTKILHLVKLYNFEFIFLLSQQRHTHPWRNPKLYRPAAPRSGCSTSPNTHILPGLFFRA